VSERLAIRAALALVIAVLVAGVSVRDAAAEAAQSAGAAADDQRLIAAARADAVAAVGELLAGGVDVNHAAPDGTTALHWAVHRDSREAAEQLIRAGANVNALTDLGVPALWIACSNGSAALVGLLLEAGASPKAGLPNGETALMACAQTGSLPAVSELLERGADPNAAEHTRGQTSLMWAVAGKHSAVVDRLIVGKADVNARSKGGFTPLLFAARAGDVDSARLLLSAGARVDEVSGDGETPMLVASASLEAISRMDYRLSPAPSGHEALAMLLLERGATPRAADQYGRTVLHFAVETRKMALARALLTTGADPNARIAKSLPYRRADYVSRAGHRGATPFWLAAMAADVEFMKLLLEGRADPKMPSANGTSPFMVAAGLGQTDSRMPLESQMLEAVKFVLTLDSNVNGVNAVGQTAVHGAASVSADNIIKFLAERGAKVNIKDKQGRTPYDLTQSVLRPRPATAALLQRLEKEAAESHP
jgi:ankyrin repeat protein